MKRQTPRLTRRQRVAAVVLAAVAACFLTLDLDRLEPEHRAQRGARRCSARSTAAPIPCSGRCAGSSQGVPHAGSNEHKVRALQHENAVLQEAARRRQRRPPHGRRAGPAAPGGDRRPVPGAAGAGAGHQPVRGLRLDGHDRRRHVQRGAGRPERDRRQRAWSGGCCTPIPRPRSSCSRSIRGSGVGARDLRTGQVGVATGVGADGFKFRPLNPKAKLRVGDQLDTGPSGSSSYVAGLAVGTITAVRVGDRRHHARDSSTPTSSPTALDLVGVILSRRRPRRYPRGAGARRTWPAAGEPRADRGSVRRPAHRAAAPGDGDRPADHAAAGEPAGVADRGDRARRRPGSRHRVRVRDRADRRSRVGTSRPGCSRCAGSASAWCAAAAPSRTRGCCAMSSPRRWCAAPRASWFRCCSASSARAAAPTSTPRCGKASSRR